MDCPSFDCSSSGRSSWPAAAFAASAGPIHAAEPVEVVQAVPAVDLGVAVDCLVAACLGDLEAALVAAAVEVG